MMALSQALEAANSMVRMNAQMVNAVAFGPTPQERYSGALIGLALRHLGVMTDLLVPEAKRWPSAFALSRVAADAALRSVYLGFGDSAPNFARRYKAFNSHPPFVAWRRAPPEDDEGLLRHLETDWGSLSSFTHSGEIQARFILHEVRTGGSPHEHVRTMVLFATTRVVTECASIVLAQQGEPQRGGFVAIEFEKAFPPDQMTDD